MPFLTSLTPAEVAHTSRSLLTVPLADSARMYCARIAQPARFVGAFDRVPASAGVPSYFRGTGGVTFEVDTGALYMGIALSHPGCLLAGSANQVLNRVVRPLLKALTKVTGKRTAYFGRDHVSAEQANVGWVAMAHSVDTNRASFEAYLPPMDADLAAGIVDAYTRAYPELRISDMSIAGEAQLLVNEDPPWSNTEDEAMGPLGILRERGGRLRFGGSLMASADRMHALNEAIQSPMGLQECGEFLDALFAAPAMLFGVRSLESFRRLICDELRGAKP
jgi:hypothetical protein